MAARDYKASSPGPDLSDKQLQDVAKTLGQEWEQAALHLGLKKEDLDEIKNEEIAEFMRKYKMLQRWKSRRPQGKTTAQDLLRGLEDLEDLPVETRRLLTELEWIRSDLVYMLSDDDVINLLRYLRKMDVLNDEEEKTVEGKTTRKDRARCLIDTVMEKGERASSLMVDYLTERHPDLCWTLGLTPTSARIRRALSNEQLLKVAETLGKVWERAAIHLDLKTEDLDGIKAENMTVIMQKYKMLQLWQSQRPFGKDTAQYLLRGLEDMEDVPVETRLLLTGFGRSQESFGSGQEGPGLMSPSLPLEMHEGDSELGYLTKDPELDLMSEESGIESMADSDSCSESSSSESMSESELSVDGKMLGHGDDKMVVKRKKQRRVRPAGSIYDVDVVNKDPSVLKFIHFPHSLCLAEPEHELSFSVLHVKGSHDSSIESTVDFTASHVKWPVSSLSRVGLIMPSSLPAKHHGAVLVYKEGNQKYFFQVYLALNSDSEIKAIAEQVNNSRKNCSRMDKPATCNPQLVAGKNYHLTSEPEGKVEPSELNFNTDAIGLKGFSEARFHERPPFRLFLWASVNKKRRNCDKPLWSATITEEDLNSEEPNIGQKGLVQNRSKPVKKKSSCSSGQGSFPGELSSSPPPKMPKSNDTLDTNRGQALSGKQLLQVAETLGQEWGRVGIYLGLNTTDLDDIKAGEADVIMQKVKMLERWQRRTPGKATAQDLLRGLQGLRDLPVETCQLLRDMINGTLTQPGR